MLLNLSFVDDLDHLEFKEGEWVLLNEGLLIHYVGLGDARAEELMHVIVLNRSLLLKENLVSPALVIDEVSTLLEGEDLELAVVLVSLKILLH
jgi:hypothetical protein